ncbi:MAG: transporter [Candidatus Paracaedibacteraceae bacterium]|nr:transporter [Candidatus Paracaedibacteraceae bacterium]
MNLFGTTLILSILFTSSVFATINTKHIDKTKYTIFSPTPSTHLRELSTDRPDKTEGPYTVDAGHYQVEFDLVTLTYDRNKQDQTRTYGHTIFAPNFRIGLLDQLELDFIMTSFNSIKTKSITDQSTDRKQGFDDTIIRFKYNFWGNEGSEKTSFGIIPFVKVPTNSNHLGNKSYDGGLIFPLDIHITDKLGLGLMTEIDYQRGESSRRHVFNFINSASLSYDFTDKISGFSEIFTQRSAEHNSKWDVTFDFGMSYSITDNVQVDAGAYVGLARYSDNITPFLGMSCRF